MSEHQQDPLFSSLRSLRRSEPLMNEADVVAALPRSRNRAMKTVALIAGLLLVGASIMWFMRDDSAPDGSLRSGIAESVRHSASALGAEDSSERTLASDTVQGKALPTGSRRQYEGREPVYRRSIAVSARSRVSAVYMDDSWDQAIEDDTARMGRVSPIRSRWRYDVTTRPSDSYSVVVRLNDAHTNEQLLLLTQDEVRSLGFMVNDTSITVPMKTETEAHDVVVSANGLAVRRRGEVTDDAIAPLMIGVRKKHARDEERVSFGDISMSSVLLGIQWDAVSANGADTSRVTAWCVPTANLIAALPDRYRVPVLLELDLLKEVERGCLSPAEACQSIPYGKSYVNKELCDRSKRTIIDVDVYPDPAQSDATCRIDLRRATTVRIALYRESGSFLGEACQESRLHEGHNELALILGDYQPGAYLLMVITADGDRMVRHLVIYR